MAQSEGFKHITVTPAEDEDVVIRAGVAAHDEAPEAAQAGPQEVAAQPEPTETPAKPDSAPAPEPVPEPAPQDAADQQERAPRKKPAKEAYHETTLEDLESKPMPLAQRIVIIAAVVCIIGALVYYFAFMR